VSRFLDIGLEAAVLITLAAACAEWSLTRFKVLERWDPTSIGTFDGPLRVAERAAMRAGVAHTDSLVRRALEGSGPLFQVRSVPEFVMLAVCACCAVLGLMFPSLAFAGGASMLDWAPVVDRALPLVVIVLSLALADQYMRLTRPGSAFVRFMRIVWANVGWVLIVLLLLADRQWVIWVGTPEQWARFGTFAELAGRTWSLVDVVNGVMTTVLGVVALASLIGPCWKLRRLFGRRGSHAAHA
jgi:hypothetical protein